MDAFIDNLFWNRNKEINKYIKTQLNYSFLMFDHKKTNKFKSFVVVEKDA
jgi:hypothetical protein